MIQSRKEWRNAQIDPKDLFAQVQASMRFGFYLSKQFFLTHQNKINVIKLIMTQRSIKNQALKQVHLQKTFQFND